MDVALIVLLLLVAVAIGWYDTFSVQRTYADLYASRHGRIPPLIDWFFVPDADPEVEEWRRRHRNMFLLLSALAAVVIVWALIRAPASG